jgi:hypothetical protein
METITIEVESPVLLGQIEALLLIANLETEHSYYHVDDLTTEDYRYYRTHRPHRIRVK